jgi:hypothetical protein
LLTIRCTAKLLLRLKAVPSAQLAPSTSALGDWHANLLRVARRQVVLFANDHSLLPVIVPAAPANTLMERFRAATGELLSLLGVSQDRIGEEVANMAVVQVSRTASRQVLGSMTDFAFMLEAYLDGGDDLMRANLRLAEAPCGPICMERPRDVAVGLLAAPKASSARALMARAGTRQISVDLAELAFALEDASPGHDWYLDLETGALVLVTEDVEDDELPLPRGELEESDRFVCVPTRPSHEGWRDMDDFVATVEAGGFRERLADAIRGKGAFGRFKRVLEERLDERERWFAFQQARLDERALEWLAERGIGSVPKAPEK